MAGKTFFINDRPVAGSTEMTAAQLKTASGIPAEKALYDADTGKRLDDEQPVGEVQRIGAVQDWTEGAA